MKLVFEKVRVTTGGNEGFKREVIIGRGEEVVEIWDVGGCLVRNFGRGATGMRNVCV